jgi:hypothetical protein
MTDRIKTPRGQIIQTEGGNAQLVWKSDFESRWNGKYDQAQRFVDSEILRLSQPFTPLQTGMLILSGELGTDVGSGEVKWIAPYAKAQYYSPRAPGSETGPLRGPFWFERMKALYKQVILDGARRLAGRGS